MRKLYLLVLTVCLAPAFYANAQWGYFSGSLETNTNFFIRDVKIGAYNMPQYDNYKVGTDAWLNLNYTNEQYGLEIGARSTFFITLSCVCLPRLTRAPDWAISTSAKK